MQEKLISLSTAVELVRDGDLIALGGNVLHRSPMAFCREVVRQNKKNLRIVKTAGGHDVDVLCLGGSVATVDAGYIGYETEFGLAEHYRKAVETGRVKANEHACYTVISALRAAMTGVPFMPVKGLVSGDLLEVCEYFRQVTDPFSGEVVTVVGALYPDIAVIHVQEADCLGNCRIHGPEYEDILLSRSAKKVIITTEKIVASEHFSSLPELTSIPDFMVSAVVLAQGGAMPGTCYGQYGLDREALNDFKNTDFTPGHDSYFVRYEAQDRSLRQGEWNR